MADIDKLSIRIAASTGTAVKNVNNLAKALEGLASALNTIDTTKLNSASQSFSNIASNVSNLKGSGRTIQTLSNSISNMGQGASNVAKTTSAIQGTAQAAANATNSISDAAKSIKEVGSAGEQGASGAKKLSSATKQTSDAVKAISAGLSGFTGTLKKVGSWFGNIASKALRAATNIKLFGKSSHSSKKNASTLAKELFRVAKMLKLMVTRMVLRKVIEGVTDGFKNLAQYSSTFDATLSMLWNSLRQLGNSIAAAVSPLLNAFAPALNYIIQLAIKAANAINQLLSALTGMTTWTRAKKLTDSYGASLDKSNKSAKALKKTVLGFDELNQLQDNNNSGGGGGASPSNMFEDVPIADKWKDWADKLKKMWENADFYDLGKELGEKLLKALQSIPWSKIYRTAAKLGKSLATLINGFVEVPELGYTIGQSLAKAINTAFYFLDDFVRNLHWKSIGKFIGETLNGFFENIKWDKIKSTVYYGVRGITQTIQEAIDTFHWDNISDTIINGLDVISMGIKEFFEGIEWGDLGQKLGDQLSKTLRNAPWKQVGEAIGSAIQAAIDWVAGVLDTLKVDDAVSAVSKMLKGIFEKVDSAKLGETLSKLFNFVVDFIVKFFRENQGDLIKEALEFFKGIFSGVNVYDLSVVLESLFSLAVLKGINSMLLYAAKEALKKKMASLFVDKAVEKVVEKAAGDAMADGLEKGIESASVKKAATSSGLVTGGLIALAIYNGIYKSQQAAKIADLITDKYKNRVLSDMAEAGASKREIEARQKDIEYLQERWAGLSGKIQMIRDEWNGGKDLELPSKTLESYKSAETSLDGIAEKAGKLKTNISQIYDSKAAESLSNMQKDAEKASNSIGICDTKAATAVKNMQNSCDALKSTTGNLAISVEKDTGSISSSVGIADTKAAEALKNMQKNINTVTFKPLSDDISKNTAESTNTIHIFDTKAEQSFKEMQKVATASVQSIDKDTKTSMDNTKKTIDESMGGAVNIVIESAGEMKSSAAECAENMTKSFNGVKNALSEDEWTTDGVAKGLTNTFEAAKAGVKRIWNSIADTLNGDHQIGGGSFPIHLPKFANGGFVEDGIFTMNHNEIAGRFNNGKTVVANNEQITDGIAQAVFNAMVSANAGNSGEHYINNTIYIDDVAVARAVTKGQNKLSRRFSPTTV